MLRTRVPAGARVVQKGVHRAVVFVAADREPEDLGDDAPCRGGAWGDPDACLAHGGSRIHKSLGLRCEWAALGEDLD